MKPFAILLSVLLIPGILSGCTSSGSVRNETAAVSAAAESGEKETVTSEEIYQQALELLCYGEADYRRNKAAKELLEIIRGYKDSGDYLDQIHEVCIKITGERVVSEFIYDQYGHVVYEKGNPYYETDSGEPVPNGIVYEYKNGKIVRENYPTGETVSYTYDELGRITEMKTLHADGDILSYTYEYEADEEGKIIRRTAYSEGEPVGERTSTYILDTDGQLSVLQHEEVPQRSPSGKDRLLTFNKKGQLVRVDNEHNYVTYTYGYVWMPEYDPSEEFVYEHRIQNAYF